MERWMMIRQLREQGLTVTEVARRLEVDRKTVHKALREDQPPAKAAPRDRPSVLDPHKDYVRGRLQEYNLSAVRLLEELREKGYAGGYSILKEFVSEIKDRQTLKAVVRFETKPGGQGQVDWADFGKVRLDGIEHKLRIFIMVLGWSRMRHVEFVLDASTESLLQCHQNAFAYFGGYPREILYDNMKQIVLDRGDSKETRTWNPLFADFAKHYGFTPRLCQPYRARTKGKVESSVKYVRGNFFEGRTFASLQDLNGQSRAWCDKVSKLPNGTTHEQPATRLPLEGLLRVDDKPPYVVTLTYPRKISGDCFVSYHDNKYSVPWRHAARDATLRIRQGKLLVDVGGTIVAEHDVVAGGHQVVRLSDHFAGLLRATRERVPQPSRIVEFSGEPVVQRRELGEYERVLEDFPEAKQ